METTITIGAKPVYPKGSNNYIFLGLKEKAHEVYRNKLIEIRFRNYFPHIMGQPPVEQFV